MHVAYEEAKKDAEALNVAVTGSEIVGLVPLQALLGSTKIPFEAFVYYANNGKLFRCCGLLHAKRKFVCSA